MFTIEGDLILFDGVLVARFEPTVWPTLRDRVIEGLDCCVSAEERARTRDAEQWNDGYNEGVMDATS